jgi:type IV pilus assembly protein PilY1
MATFGPQLSSDDGFQDAGFWTPNQAYFGFGTTGTSPGFRFTNVTIPNGATVTSATFQFRARNAVTGTITNIHHKLRAHLGDAPAFADGTFEPTVNFTATTAGVDFDPSAWVVDTLYQIDFTSVAQEVFSDGSWASGNDLAIVLFDDGSVTGNSARMYTLIDGDTVSPQITIEYTEGGGGGTATFTINIGSPRPNAFAPGIAR